MSDTPPVQQSAPITTRYEYVMGYHKAIVEKDGASHWIVTLVSPLINGLEVLYYDDELLAQDGARTYLNGVYNAEMSVRSTFYSAYDKAFGRGSAPDSHGPHYAPPPTPATISSISPNIGLLAGGESITITGTGLTGSTGATFGGVAGTGYAVVDDTQATVIAPAGAAVGVVDFVLTDDAGAVTLAGGYTYQ